jgi:addiction module HigA family antidote
MAMPSKSRSSITIDPFAPSEWIKPHPGEILREEYLEPLRMSASELARHLGVPANRITAILNEQRSVTADTAWRLARYWGTTAHYWMNMQQAHDLSKAWVESGARIAKEVSPRKSAEAA